MPQTTSQHVCCACHHPSFRPSHIHGCTRSCTVRSQVVRVMQAPTRANTGKVPSRSLLESAAPTAVMIASSQCQVAKPLSTASWRGPCSSSCSSEPFHITGTFLILTRPVPCVLTNPALPSKSSEMSRHSYLRRPSAWCCDHRRAEAPQ